MTTNSPRVAGLLEFLEVDTDSLYKVTQTAAKGGPKHLIAGHLYRAIEDYTQADRDYTLALASLGMKVETEVENAAAGFAPNPMWIEQATQQAIAAAAKMAETAKLAMTTNAVRKAMSL